MKRYTIISMLIILIAFSSSCSPQQKDDNLTGIDSDTFLSSVTMPDKLSIDIQFDDIKNITKAKTYQVEPITFDKQKLIDVFIKNTVIDEKIWAEGPQIIASSGSKKEFLNINDGGKSFGVENGLFGFSYFFYENDVFLEKLNIVASTTFEKPNPAEQIYGYNLNSDYVSFRDLNFLPYQDALQDIEKLLDSAGIPPYIVDETYSLDLETMMTQYELFLRSNTVEEDQNNLSWTKDDESYIFSLRQIVDSIPVANQVWHMPSGTKETAMGNPMPTTNIHLIYDKTGIRKITAHTILRITDELQNNNLINLYQALKTMIDYYSLTILETDVHIVSAELCYLIMPDKDTLELVPGWMFCSSKTTASEGETFIEYRYDVVNAVTGKLYAFRW